MRKTSVAILSFIFTLIMLVSSVPATVQAKVYEPTDSDDFSQLKWKIANDPDTQFNLGTLGNALGFAWMGGTRDGKVDTGYDVWQDSDGNIHLKGHYDRNDPHADGYRSDERTEIILSNFRYNIDPNKISWGTPVIKEIGKVSRGTTTLINLDTKKDATETQTLTYQQVKTKSHTVKHNFTTGVKLGASVKVSSAPFGIGGEATGSFEFNFSTENGWDNQTSTADWQAVTQTVTAPVAPNSQKIVRALSTVNQSDLPYTVKAEILYDITYKGFLRYTGNARTDHPTDRPTVEVTFGNNGIGGWQQVKDQYEHRNIKGYSQWDWDWAEQNGDPNFNDLMTKVDPSSEVFITGSFSVTVDVSTTFEASDNMPIGTVPGPSMKYTVLIPAPSDQSPAPSVRVAADGSGDYTTIAAAIEALPSTGGNIEVAPGVYKEKLLIKKDKVNLIGTGSDASKVTITNNDYHSKINPATGQPYGTSGSATVTVTGSDFYATNLTIQNTADYEAPGYEANAQAVALLTKGDRAVYRAVRVLGGQDTLYVTGTKRAYFNNCYVEGYVDYIFGNGKAVFDKCTIKSKVHTDLRGQVTITAQKRASASEDSGFVFNNNTLLFDDEYMDNVWLGRPWGAYSTVYWLNTKMGPQVTTPGWIEFIPAQYAPPGVTPTNNLPTSTYREYKTVYTSGAFDISKRESTAPKSNVELTDSEAAALAADTYLAGADKWQPTTVVFGTMAEQNLPIPTLPVGTPGAPTIYSVTAGNKNLEASWGGKPANPQTSGYRLWAIQNGAKFGPVTLPPTATSGFIGGLANGVPAEIHVAGINAIGLGTGATSDSVIPVSDAPAAPSSISFQFNGSSVNMVFNIADQGSQPVFGGTVEHAGAYTALYASQNDAYAGKAIAGTSQGFTTNKYTFTNLKPNTTYWVSLYAYNGKYSPKVITSFKTGSF